VPELGPARELVPGLAPARELELAAALAWHSLPKPSRLTKPELDQLLKPLIFSFSSSC